MSPIMPTELILHTISQLNPETDKPTLSTCALISSTFQIDAQKRLFSSVRLITDFQWDSYRLSICAKASETSQMFLDAITISPHLASLVHNLELQVSESRPSTDDITFEHWLLRHGLDHLPTVGQSSQLINILYQLRHLRVLSISGTRAVNWHRLNPDLKCAFMRTIRHNPLHTISMVGLEDVRLGSFYKSLHLRTLTLRDLSANEAIPAQLLDSKPQSIRLKSLTLDTEFNGRVVMKRLLKFTGHPASPLTLSKLTHLTIASDDIRHVPKLLSRCANSLTHLTLSIPRKAKYSYSTTPLTSDEVAAICPLVDLRSLYNLRSLSLTKCRIHSEYRPSSSNGSNSVQVNHVEKTKTSFPWVNALLATVPTQGSNPLSLQIEIQICDVTAHNLNNSVPWDPLTKQLLGLRRDYGVQHRIVFTSATHHKLPALNNVPSGCNTMFKALKSNPIFSHFRMHGSSNKYPHDVLLSNLPLN